MSTRAPFLPPACSVCQLHHSLACASSCVSEAEHRLCFSDYYAEGSALMVSNLINISVVHVPQKEEEAPKEFIRQATIAIGSEVTAFFVCRPEKTPLQKHYGHTCRVLWRMDWCMWT